LFKFAYIGRYLTEHTDTARYWAVQTGTGQYLTGTISDINVYPFFAGTDRYGMVFITMVAATVIPTRHVNPGMFCSYASLGVVVWLLLREFENRSYSDKSSFRYLQNANV